MTQDGARRLRSLVGGWGGLEGGRALLVAVFGLLALPAVGLEPLPTKPLSRPGVVASTGSTKRKTPTQATPAGKSGSVPVAAVPLRFDVKRTPFSRSGSTFAFSELTPLLPPLLEGVTEGEGLYFRNLRAGARDRALRIDLLEGQKPAPFRTEASAGVLRLLGSSGSAAICFATRSVVRIRAEGVGVRLSSLHPGANDFALPAPRGRFELNLSSHATRYALVPIEGSLEVDAPMKSGGAERIVVDLVPGPKTGIAEMALEPYDTHWTKTGLASPPFEACVRDAEADFARFERKAPKVAASHEEAKRLAVYILWSAAVAPEGLLRRPALLMSKNWRNRVSSWEHAFGAMTLASSDPALAWDQLMVPFDSQHQGGALPESVDDGGLVWNFTSPPVHGLALRAMMRRSQAVGPKQLAQIYDPLSRWTLFWLERRDDDGDGVPQYNHGNDSGWDDASITRAGLPLEAPDLSAFLVIQMDVLAQIAKALRKPAEARAWTARADGLTSKLLAHSWKVNRFIAPHSGDHRIADGDSLALFLPLVLGNRLPEDVRRALVLGLREGGRFSTRYGLATESVKSPAYEADRNWRGPIWAPSTWLLVEGLESVGEDALAREVARRFCDMAAASGMAESFDAQGGQGLRDPACTFTAAVFLDLASRYASRE